MPDLEPVDHRSVWLGRCAPLLGGAWLVLRAPNLLTSPRFWAEEAAFVSAATSRSALDSLTFVYWRQGYFSWPENVGASIGVALLPLDLAPLATTLLALVLQLSPLLAVSWLRFDLPLTPFQRLVAGVALLTATTTGQGMAWLNTISSQMHLGILTSVILIASARQATRPKSWALVWTLFLTGMGGAYSIFLLPVFMLAAVAERNPWRARQVMALSTAFMVQITIVLYKRFGLNLVNERRGAGEWTFDRILGGLREAISLPMFGQRAVLAEDAFRNFVLFVGLLVVATAASVLVRSARTRSAGSVEAHRMMGVLRSLGSVELRAFWAWILTVTAIGLSSYDGLPAGRYAVVPGALTLSILLMAAHRARRGPVRLVLIGVVFGSIAAGVWNPRYPEMVACDGTTSGYRVAVRTWNREARAELPICPEGWTVRVYPPRAKATS